MDELYCTQNVQYLEHLQKLLAKPIIKKVILIVSPSHSIEDSGISIEKGNDLRIERIPLLNECLIIRRIRRSDNIRFKYVYESVIPFHKIEYEFIHTLETIKQEKTSEF